MPIEDNKQHPKGEIKRGIKAIWRHTRSYKGRLVVLVVLGLISSIANGFVPYITGRFFDSLVGLSQNRIASGWGDLPIWMLLLAAWALVQIIANNVDWVMDRLRRGITNHSSFKFQTEAFIHLFRLPLSYHKNSHINGELHKIGSASWRLSSTLATTIELSPQFLSILIGITLAASINIMLASVLLVGVLLYVILLVRILLPIAALDSAAHRAMNEGWDNAAAAVLQIESVKQSSAEDYETTKVRSSLLGRANDLWFKLERNWSNVSFFQRTIVFLTQLVVFILSIRLVATGVITIGELVSLNGYALMFFGPFVSLGFNWQVIQTGITAVAHAEEIFDQPQEVYSPKENTNPGLLLKGEVAFQDVSFRYAPGQPEVLSDMDFKVEPGQIVALVGESGVGKSTAISLISAYYFPSKGSVLIDGVDTHNIDLYNLRKQIAVVPQEVALFNDTIKTNICYGSFDASGEDVKRVAIGAHIDEFISTLPDGYETLVGERGIKLSVGQKQRVSIARAMLRNPSILILDEPTSALDAQTERIVTEALGKLMRGRTTFIIAHRLSTVRKADKIFVFQKGKIIETGSHDELIKKEGGVYRHLYDYQIGLH